MGQKAHPYGLRLGYIKPWKARWFGGKNFSLYLHEDLKIRKHLKEKLGYAGISSIEIERSRGKVRVKIHTARPGVIIGRRGQEIEKVKDDLSAITNSELFVDIKEVKSPQTDAQLVAENIAMQLERRIGFRRAMKKTVQMAMMKGALGIKVCCKGRLGGSEIARMEHYRDGKVPLSTFRADVDYGFTEAKTTYGAIGCKVWIYKGDILIKKQLEEQRKARELRSVEADKGKTEEKKQGAKGAAKNKVAKEGLKPETAKPEIAKPKTAKPETTKAPVVDKSAESTSEIKAPSESPEPPKEEN